MVSAPLSWNVTERITMGTPASEHLKRYVTERLPELVPGMFDGAPDQPSFTVDQNYRPLEQPPYRP